jgi:hypothetical protein
MTNERKENRVNIKNLLQAGHELTPEEAKDVHGGQGNLNDHKTGALRNTSGNDTSQSPDGIVVSSGPDAGGHIRVFDGAHLGG